MNNELLALGEVRIHPYPPFIAERQLREARCVVIVAAGYSQSGQGEDLQILFLGDEPGARDAAEKWAVANPKKQAVIFSHFDHVEAALAVKWGKA